MDILGWDRKRADARAEELLGRGAYSRHARVLRAYPHELSGGMRQRILIASAFCGRAEADCGDEPTTALDVTVQKQVLRLIAEMQARHGTALLFVTHDLGVVSKVCQSLTVLYAGWWSRIPMCGLSSAGPRHAYSRALLAATPKYTDPAASLVPCRRT